MSHFHENHDIMIQLVFMNLVTNDLLAQVAPPPLVIKAEHEAVILWVHNFT